MSGSGGRHGKRHHGGRQGGLHRLYYNFHSKNPYINFMIQSRSLRDNARSFIKL